MSLEGRLEGTFIFDTFIDRLGGAGIFRALPLKLLFSLLSPLELLESLDSLPPSDEAFLDGGGILRCELDWNLGADLLRAANGRWVIIGVMSSTEVSNDDLDDTDNISSSGSFAS